MILHPAFCRKIHHSGKRHRHHQRRIEPADIHSPVQRPSDHRPQRHPQIQSDIIGAVRKTSFFFSCQKDRRGLADRTHDPISPGKERGGEKHHCIALHHSKEKDRDELTAAAYRKKYVKRNFVKQILKRQPQYDQHHCIEREEHADCHVKPPHLGIRHEKGLGRTVGNRKEHDDERDGNDPRIDQFQALLLPAFRFYRLAPVPDKLNRDHDRGRKDQCNDKGCSVTEVLIDTDPDRRRQSHPKRIHGPIHSHSGSHLLLRQHIGHPGRHAHGTARESKTIYDPRDHHDRLIRRKDIAHACGRHKYRAEKGDFIFAELIRQIARQRTAEKGDQVHQPSDKSHHCRSPADALRKSRDQRRHQHRA